MFQQKSGNLWISFFIGNSEGKALKTKCKCSSLAQNSVHVIWELLGLGLLGSEADFKK